MHLSAWVLYGSFIFIANDIANPGIRITHTIFFLIPRCLTFYISIYCLGLYRHRGIPWSIASFFIVFVIMSLVAYCYIYIILPKAGVKVFSSDKLRDFLKNAVLGYVQYFSYALLYFYVAGFFRRERELAQIREEKQLKDDLQNANLKEQELVSEKEKLQLEYAFLRSQLNPHFLHNTLNVLFSQALDHSQELADNISKLSRMMRYSMENTAPGIEKVQVESELNMLRLLIDINSTRFENLAVDFRVEGLIDGQLVPPLAMLTIVENAFKYGELKDPRFPLKIEARFRPRFVYFACTNKKNRLKSTIVSTNIGIANLRKRLELSFRDQYVINMIDTDEFYTFELSIKN